MVQLHTALQAGALDSGPAAGGPLRLHGHHAPLFGMVAGLLELGRDEAMLAFLFNSSRDAVSAAVRLNIVGEPCLSSTRNFH